MKIQVPHNEPSGSNKHRRKIKAIRRSATFCCEYRERERERGKLQDFITLETITCEWATIRHPNIRVKHCAYGHSVATLLNPRGVTTVSPQVLSNTGFLNRGSARCR
jgi:3-methyladenine DNA glycosylase Tag